MMFLFLLTVSHLLGLCAGSADDDDRKDRAVTFLDGDGLRGHKLAMINRAKYLNETDGIKDENIDDLPELEATYLTESYKKDGDVLKELGTAFTDPGEAHDAVPAVVRFEDIDAACKALGDNPKGKLILRQRHVHEVTEKHKEVKAARQRKVEEYMNLMDPLVPKSGRRRRLAVSDDVQKAFYIKMGKEINKVRMDARWSTKLNLAARDKDNSPLKLLPVEDDNEEDWKTVRDYLNSR